MHYPKTEMYLFFESIIERTLCVRALRTQKLQRGAASPPPQGLRNVGEKISKAPRVATLGDDTTLAVAGLLVCLFWFCFGFVFIGITL